MKTSKTFITIDPPSGWKYGFPKAVTPEQYKEITSLKQWCIDNGYPKEEADSYGDYFHIQINGDVSFMNKKLSNPLGKTWDEIEQTRSTREQALAWWNKLTLKEKQDKTYYYCTGNGISTMEFEIHHIEEIWLKETSLLEIAKEHGVHPEVQRSADIIAKQHDDYVNSLKSNQKQFKQVNSILINAYFDKFSKDDLENVILPILQTKIKTN